jgi:hypothetical protein
MKNESYPIYKGLQRPLVFKMFKGKYIYYAMASIGTGILFGGIISAAVNSILGVILLAVISGLGIAYTMHEQSLGLYRKKKIKGIFIVPPVYHINYEKDEI